MDAIALSRADGESATRLDLDNADEGAWYQVGIESDDGEGWIYGSTRAVSYQMLL